MVAFTASPPPPTAAAAAVPATPGTGAAAEPSPALSTSKEGIAGGPDTDIDLCGNLIVFAEIPSPSSPTGSGAGGGGGVAAASRLLCVVCKSLFQNPWDLMVHVQTAHMINIYELGASATAQSSDTSSQSQDKDPQCVQNGIQDKNATNNSQVPSGGGGVAINGNGESSGRKEVSLTFSCKSN